MDNQNKAFRVLVINPGSTSTKLGVFDGEQSVFIKTVRHQREALDACGGVGVYAQKDLRKRLVLEALEESGVTLDTLDAVVGRASRLPPMQSGTYTVNDALMAAVPDPLISPALLGMIIAKELGDQLGIPAFIVDPTNVDEFCDLARVTGIPEIRRISSFHALNQKAVARRAAKELGKRYEDCRLVVAHLGGGMSVGAHLYGRVVDSTHGSEGEGAFTPERAGYVPGHQLVKLCFSGKYTQAELEGFFVRQGGMLKYLGTTDMVEVVKRVESGDAQATLLFNAMAYNVAKVIGSMYAVLACDIDALVLTGGLTYSALFVERILERVGKLGPHFVYPGEDELLAMAQGALRVLTGEYAAQVFVS